MVQNGGLGQPLAFQSEADRVVPERPQQFVLVLGHSGADPDEQDPPDQPYPETVETHMNPPLAGARMHGAPAGNLITSAPADLE